MLIWKKYRFGYGRGVPRRTKSKDDDTHSESPSPLRLGDDLSIDGESSGLERSMPAPEEPPYFPEQWYYLLTVMTCFLVHFNMTFNILIYYLHVTGQEKFVPCAI